MRNTLTTIVVLIGFLFNSQAQEKENKVLYSDTIPRAEISTTTGTVQIDGETIRYKAVAGTMEMRDIHNKPACLFGYTAYTVDGSGSSQSSPKNKTNTRPIVFAFNGGPGSSSMWLHMGALGPRRVLVNDPTFTPNAPYEIVNNSHSILDIADLVMIDPVGTGLSVPLGKKEFKDFWGVDEDIESISHFIKQYLIENGRLNSPKYLLGESYGTFRNAGIMDHMQSGGIAFNGVIMVSAVFDLHSLMFPEGSDLSYIVHFPTFAATAWYHNELENRPDSLEQFLDDVRRFTEEEYAPALFKGDQITDEERSAIIVRLAKYSGISDAIWRKADLRLKAGEYFAELLRDEGENVGRLDSRFRNINQDLLGQNADHDPFTAALMPPFGTAFLHYFYGELKVNPKLQYSLSAYSHEGFKWNWDHKGNMSWGTRTSINTGPDLARAITQNPHTKVLIMNSYFDLATVFYGVEYGINHLGLHPDIKKNIKMTYYKSGHMMYVHEPSFAQFKKDIFDFIQASSNL